MALQHNIIGHEEPGAHVCVREFPTGSRLPEWVKHGIAVLIGAGFALLVCVGLHL